MTEAQRAYIYRIALAVTVVLIAYGVVTEDQAAVWLQVLVAALALGPQALATANTSTKSE